MDSSLKELERKGVLSAIGDIYNPEGQYDVVLHFTPHKEDLELAGRLSEHKIELQLHPAGWLSIRRFFRAVLLARQRIKESRINIVRGRLPYLGSLIGAVAARLSAIPFVVSLGGDNRIVQERTGTYHYKSRIISYGMEWLVLMLATAIICPNLFTTRYVADIIGTRAAARRCNEISWLSRPLPKSCDSDDSTITALGFSAGTRIVPIVGFINRYKFSDILFNVLGELATSLPEHEFCFCGDGPLREEGERRFAKIDNVRFLGWQSANVVHALLRRAEIVLIPMSGFVLLEAASLGKPVVTSNVEWHSEMVKNDISGLVVEPTDPMAWRTAIWRMVSEPDMACRLGCQLEKAYVGNYAYDSAVKRELALYHQLVRQG